MTNEKIVEELNNMIDALTKVQVRIRMDDDDLVKAHGEGYNMACRFGTRLILKLIEKIEYPLGRNDWQE